MPYSIVAIELYAATQPNNRISVGVEVHFRDPDKMHPPKSSGIAGGEPKRFLDMSLGFLGAPHINLGNTNPSVCAR